MNKKQIAVYEKRGYDNASFATGYSKEKADFDRFFHYLSVVLAFIAGAIVLVFCHHLFGAHSILIVSILFLIMALTQTFHLWQFYHTNRFTI